MDISSSLSSTSTTIGPFIPPEKPSAFSGKSFALWCINIMTAGIYSSVEMISKSYEISQLNQREQELTASIQSNQKKFNKLREELAHLKETANGSAFDQEEIVNHLADIEKKARKYAVETDDPRNDNIQQIAFGPIQFFASLIYNLLTVGVYGVVQSNRLDYEVVCLQAKEKYLESHIDAERIDSCNHLLEEISMVNEFMKLKGKMKFISSSPDGQNILKLNEDVDRLTRTNAEWDKKYRKLCNDLQQVKDEKTQLEQTKKRLEDAKNNAENEMKKYRDSYDGLYAEKVTLSETNIQLTQQANAWTLEKSNLNYNLRQAQERATKASNELTDVNRRLKEAEKKIESAQAAPGISLDQLAPIPPKYIQTAEDKPIKGDYEDAEGKPLKDSEYGKVYCGKTLAELLRVGFDRAYDKLVKMGTPPAPEPKAVDPKPADPKAVDQKAADPKAPGTPKAADPKAKAPAKDGKVQADPRVKIQFRNSWSIAANDPIKTVIYMQMMYELISGAKLHKGVNDADCHGFSLNFNPYVTVGASKPVRVQAVKVEGEGDKKITKTEVQTIYTNIDELTPVKEKKRALVYGVDPISVKLILHKLTPAEKEHLLNLINEPLIDDAHPDLMATRAFMKAPQNAERAKLIDTACSLLNDIAVSVEHRYTDVLQDNWSVKLDNADYDPIFTKEVKVDKVQNAPPVKVDDTEIWKVWKIETKHFDDITIKVEDTIPGMDTRSIKLREFITTMIYDYQVIAENISKGIVANPMKSVPVTCKDLWNREVQHVKLPDEPTKALTMLSSQYWISHYVYDHGCFFSNMFAAICSDSKIVKNNAKGNIFVQYLKNAMANYLETKEGRERFAQDIAAEHKKKVVVKNGWQTTYENMTVEDYQYWLRNAEYSGHPSYLYTAIKKDALDHNKTRTITLRVGYDIGNLELEICAHMLGLRFIMFVTGDAIQVDSNGLILPKDITNKGNSFGPETGAHMPLLNYKAGSFYGLFPKLKVPKDSTYVVSEAIGTLNKYWEDAQQHAKVTGYLAFG